VIYSLQRNDAPDQPAPDSVAKAEKPGLAK